MLRSWRGDRRCIFSSGVVVLLTLFFLSIASSSFPNDNPCPHCSNNTPKDYCLTVEDIKNCRDDSLSDLNGEYKLVQYPDGGDSCMWHYNGNSYANSIELADYLLSPKFELAATFYTPFGGTTYFSFYPDSCTEEMYADIWEVASCGGEDNVDDVYGGHATLAPCKVPKIENLTIYPEYWKFKNNLSRYGSRLWYEQVFTKQDAGKRYLEPYAEVKIDSDTNQNYVNWTMQVNDSTNKIVYLNNSAMFVDSKKFTVSFPYKNVTQDSLLIFKLKICDDETCNEILDEKTVSAYTPKFDILVKNIDAGNVIFNDTELVENKPIAIRAYLEINSSVKEINNSGSINLITNYISAAKDIKVSLFVDGIKESESVMDLKNYEGKETLKARVTDNSFNLDERKYAMEILQSIYKKANDTKNYIGYIPQGKTRQLSIKISSDSLNEFNSTNNNLSKVYTLRTQKDPDFKIIFFGMNMRAWEGNFNITNYRNEIQRMNETYDFLKSAFPFDPKKVSSKIYAIPGMATGGVFSSSVDTIALRYTQKIADKDGADIAFGVIPAGAMKNVNKNPAGITRPKTYKKAAVIKESQYYNTYAHEAGHLFGLYLDNEQTSGPPCPPEQYGNMDVGLLSSDGWCMNQETGKPCVSVATFAPRGFNGENINVWTDRGSSIGFYASNDAPLDYNLLPFGNDPKELAPLRNFDIMGLSNLVWVRKDPTYDKLKQGILA